MRRTIIFSTLLFLCACGDNRAGERVSGDPSQIDVPNALKSIAYGVTEFRNAIAGGQPMGVMLCKIQVDFNISALAGGQQKNQATISGGNQYGKAELSGERDSTSTGSRENHVQIIFGGIYPGICSVAAGVQSSNASQASATVDATSNKSKPAPESSNITPQARASSRAKHPPLKCNADEMPNDELGTCFPKTVPFSLQFPGNGR